MVRCLVLFFQDIHWRDFRLAELDALLELVGVESERQRLRSESHGGLRELKGPYLELELPSRETAELICERSVLIKHIYELLGEGHSLSELYSNTVESAQDVFARYDSEDTWCLKVDGYMRNLTHDEKMSCINDFPLPFRGKVSLKEPVVPVSMLLDYSKIDEEGNLSTRIDKGDYLDFSHAYCGILWAKGGMREELKKYDLKKRFYLGPTSLDHSLALIMATISRVKPGCFVLDPFVGTASILVAASHFRAQCFGCDIDIRVLKGSMHAGVRVPTKNLTAPPPTTGLSSKTVSSDIKEDIPSSEGKDGEKGGISEKKRKRKRGDSTKKLEGDIQRSIWENFRAYGLNSPEVIRMDNHLFDTHCTERVVGGMFDAIVTDPPYGIRAGAKKTGRKGKSSADLIEKRDDYIPATQNYQVEEVMLDLLHMAALSLKMNGILSYLIPAPYGTTEQDLPAHPCLRIEMICEQGLSTRHCRYLVVMRKHKEYSQADRDDYRNYSAKVLRKEGGMGFEVLIDKLREALTSDPLQCRDADSGVVIKASNSSMKRKLNKEKRIQLKKEGRRHNGEQNSGGKQDEYS